MFFFFFFFQAEDGIRDKLVTGVQTCALPICRDQARAGAEVAPVVEALRPGDILLFAAQPGSGVTHVGMYVGEWKFIHSSNRGVKLSRLDVRDPEGAYWLDRWVGARRVNSFEAG